MPHTAPLPAIYFPHGGGPCFFMDWDPPHTWDNMRAYLEHLPQDVGVKPKYIVVISAHWEEDEFTVQTTPEPELYYDYYNFPPHTYQLNWPARNDDSIAARVISAIADAGLPVRTEAVRGYDHGVFIPLLVAYPDIDVPVLQVSMKKGYSPEAHFKLGQALAPLRSEGALMIGSGMSYHNLRAFFHPLPGGRNASHEFDDWLQGLLKLESNDRLLALSDWAKAPGARAAHPREDHLVPLMVIAGTAGNDVGRTTYHEDSVGRTGIAISAFQFDAPP
jgi:aromatic ring-opening dioxygenase catalytic subunit (LigB family)